MDILDHIAAFRAALNQEKAIEEVTTWWNRCLSIETAIEMDSRASRYENETIKRLKSAATDAIVTVRDLDRSPDTGRISVALTALQHSVEKRTTGPDGWPLRR